MKISSCCTVLLAALWIAFPGAWAQNIYNDDPMQTIPLGTKESEYYYRYAKGGKVDQVRVEPPFWWVGMNHPTVEVLIYDQDIKGATVSVNYPGVKVNKVNEVQNPNYLFVELAIGPGTAAGKFPIELTLNGKKRAYSYELRNRNRQSSRAQGLSNADFIYMLMPDRFANGDPGNDSYNDMNASGANRGKIFFRHGGDIMGIMERLDYLQELGVTAIWPTPVLENDQPYQSYHGYAVTDHYQIDKRFGSNELYQQFVEKCHSRGMKVVMDIIHNHVGDQHWFIRDLPSEDWIHQFPEFTRSIYREPVWMDPYGSKVDQDATANGWFDRHMPDLNQQQPQLANYLIQNNIWWIEYSGHDAYRIDTYYYPDQAFLAQWCKRIKDEFPNFHLFGETWVHGPAVQAFFTQNNNLVAGFNSNLPGVTDFQMHYAMMEAVNGKQGWTDGVNRLYYTLAQDFLYEDPFRNVLFLDNHDTNRYFSSIGEDFAKYKTGIALLMTMRGIPCMYYATEILMTGQGGAFGEAGRRDFPGGWREDKVDKFKSSGRNQQEQEAYEYVRKLSQYRKNNPVLHRGKLMQYVPDNGVYVYFRYDGTNTVMVLVNSTDKPVEVSTTRFHERMSGYSTAMDVVSGEILQNLTKISLQRNETKVLELR